VRTYRSGESWIEPAGWVHEAGNAGAAPAAIAVTFLLPKGAALTTLAAPAPTQLPRTGDPGLGRAAIGAILLLAAGRRLMCLAKVG